MSRAIWLWASALVLVGCQQTSVDRDSTTSAISPSADMAFAAVPESAWVNVGGLTLVGFYPIVSNEKLALDADLATALDDFSYHIGSAMDSLLANGVTVHYRGGDTLWLRTRTDRWRVVRTADSADVGYVLADTTRNTAIIYGVRTYVDLIEYVHEFKRTGRILPR